MTQVPFIISQNSVTVFIGGAPSTVHKSHPHFADVLEYLKRRDHDEGELSKLVSIPKKIEGETFGAVTVGKDGNLYYKNVEVKSAMADKVLEVIRQGFPVEMWALFLNNLMENPSESSQEEMHLFMEACYLPMTPDGCFLAYKKVRQNYTDGRTGNIDNSIGQVVTMERSEVNADRRTTCSTGLHFCSREYLGNTIGGTRIMVVKVNPRDVVSIPDDYNNSKGRCCRYEVVGELTSRGAETYSVPHDKVDALESSVINTDYAGKEPDKVDELEQFEEDFCDECGEDVMDCDCWGEDVVYEGHCPDHTGKEPMPEEEDAMEITFTHKKTGLSFSEAALRKMIDKATSLRGLATELGIPKSTMQDWASRLKETQEKET